jgi:hypothetical protein
MAEAQRLGIADRLMMPGFLKDPSRFVGLFDIFALSSDSEQYPISLVEAMAAARRGGHQCRRCGGMVSRENRRFITATRTMTMALQGAIARTW